MNNNTKAKYKLTNGKSRRIAFANSKPRNKWNKTGKVAGKPKCKLNQ